MVYNMDIIKSPSFWTGILLYVQFGYLSQSGPYRSDSTRYLTGTKASRAYMYMLGRTLHDSFYTLNIRLPRSVGTMMRVGYLNTESNALSADVTFCHGAAPPLKRLTADVFGKSTTYRFYHKSNENASAF